MFFSKLFNKIELTSEMKLMAESLIDNKWFRNCGKVNNFNIPFNYQFSSGIDEVEKQLSYRNDIKGFVTLENLFIEAGFRGQIFLSLHNKKEHNSWNKITDLIVKNYIKNKKFDFSKIESLYFDSVYNMNVNLFLKEVFITTLREVYFQSKIENYPFFFEKKNITVEQSKVEMIRGTKYIIEEKVIYDSLGILEIYAGASEGFVVYSRDNDFGKSVIKEEGYSNKVLIDKKQDCLIDGKDTIRNFEVFLKDRLIMVYPKEGDRIYVYKFK